MTLVNLTAEETVLGGFAAVASGVVTATYWAGQVPYTTVEGSDVRFPSKITVQIRDGQPVEPVEMVPTRGVCCVRWKVSDLRSGRSLSRYTEIPDAESVDFGDLPVVDPATFAPVVPTPTLLETINTQVAAYLVENPAASPEEIATAVEAYLVEHPVEGVTQAQLDAAVAGLARSADLAQVATSGAYTDLDGIPALDFAPTVHTHAQSDVDGLTAVLASKVDTDDPRLSDARTPVAHTHEIGDVTGLEDALANAGGGDGGLSGTGSPEGSRPATVGTIYTDTAATTGAIRWIKASGTGATGWRVLWGDTGPRSLPLPDGLSNGLITIQRYADEVTIRLQSINVSGGAVINIFTLPPGWLPLTQPTGVAIIAGGTSVGALIVNGGTLALHSPNGNFRHAILKYQTPDPWPTILPGTAA